MRFVIDANVSPRVAELLEAAGYAVSRVVEAGRTDIEILSGAVADGAVIVTGDQDFADLCFARGEHSTGIVRIAPAMLVLGRDAVAQRLLEVVTARETSLHGTVTIIEPNRVRQREFD